ncbi:MAG: hypothetical protein ABI474_02590 [Actinomycetota bacterium]
MASLGFPLDASPAVDLGADAAVRPDTDDLPVGSPAATRRRDHPLQRDPRGHHAREGDARKDDGADHDRAHHASCDGYPEHVTDRSTHHRAYYLRGPGNNRTHTDRNLPRTDDNLTAAESARHTA